MNRIFLPAIPPFLPAVDITPLVMLPLNLLLLPFIILRGVQQQGSFPQLPKGNPRSSYSNEETWEIKRGANGRIAGISIHRDARES